MSTVGAWLGRIDGCGVCDASKAHIGRIHSLTKAYLQHIRRYRFDQVLDLSGLCRVVAAVEALASASEDWSDSPLLLTMGTTIDTGSNSAVDMDELSTEAQKLLTVSEKHVADFSSELVARCLAQYGRSNLFETSGRGDILGSPDVSEAIVDAAVTLQSCIQLKQEILSEVGVLRVVSLCAELLDTFMMKEIMLSKKFSSDGAKQLGVDVSALEDVFERCSLGRNFLLRSRSAAALLRLPLTTLDAIDSWTDEELKKLNLVGISVDVAAALSQRRIRG